MIQDDEYQIKSTAEVKRGDIVALCLHQSIGLRDYVVASCVPGSYKITMRVFTDRYHQITETVELPPDASISVRK